MAKKNIWTPEQGKKDLEYFTEKGYKNGGIMDDSKFQRRFMISYPEIARGMVGLISRLAEGGKVNYYLHVFKLIDNKELGVHKKWRSVIDFMKVPEKSKLGKDLIELEEKEIQTW